MARRKEDTNIDFFLEDLKRTKPVRCPYSEDVEKYLIELQGKPQKKVFFIYEQ